MYTKLEYYYLQHFESMIQSNQFEGDYFCYNNFGAGNFYISKLEYVEYMVGDDRFNNNNIQVILKICDKNNLFDISNYKFDDMSKLNLKSSIKENVLKDINKYLKLSAFL